MKNKYVKYGLIIIVSLIWGRLIINYFGLFQGSDEIEFVPEVVEKPQIKLDTLPDYQLKLNYNDPFLSQNRPLRKIQSSNSGSNNNPTKKTIELPAIKEPKIVYKGLVKNKNSAKKTGLVVIDGKSYLITSAKEINSIRIINFNEKELQYVYQNKRKLVLK